MAVLYRLHVYYSKAQNKSSSRSPCPWIIVAWAWVHWHNGFSIKNRFITQSVLFVVIVVPNDSPGGVSGREEK